MLLKGRWGMMMVEVRFESFDELVREIEFGEEVLHIIIINNFSNCK
jgi:ribosomal protein S6